LILTILVRGGGKREGRTRMEYESPIANLEKQKKEEEGFKNLSGKKKKGPRLDASPSSSREGGTTRRGERKRGEKGENTFSNQRGGEGRTPFYLGRGRGSLECLEGGEEETTEKEKKRGKIFFLSPRRIMEIGKERGGGTFFLIGREKYLLEKDLQTARTEKGGGGKEEKEPSLLTFLGEGEGEGKKNANGSLTKERKAVSLCPKKRKKGDCSMSADKNERGGQTRGCVCGGREGGKASSILLLRVTSDLAARKKTWEA